MSLGHGLRFVRLRDFLSVLRHRRQRQDVKNGLHHGPVLRRWRLRHQPVRVLGFSRVLAKCRAGIHLQRARHVRDLVPAPSLLLLPLAQSCARETRHRGAPVHGLREPLLLHAVLVVSGAREPEAGNIPRADDGATERRTTRVCRVRPRGQVALQPQPAYYGQQGPVATGYPVAQGNPYSNPGGNPYANTQAYPPPAHRMS